MASHNYNPPTIGRAPVSMGGAGGEDPNGSAFIKPVWGEALVAAAAPAFSLRGSPPPDAGAGAFAQQVQLRAALPPVPLLARPAGVVPSQIQVGSYTQRFVRRPGTRPMPAAPAADS